ncbi:carboxy-terminal kinesin 2 [Karstenula rhodostoma CBS 690.94]|uniref:Kinesin-like protein n=1 Tax=Karstenula rhodostoma CBS 690.94 TaxID=1392251 RepID=A0A9P4PPI6_9PLEO|nr:carboxy-terminal kinesin 2 [Karstenula rhodostoma CBS 690.94]
MRPEIPSATAAAASPPPFHGPPRPEHQDTRPQARAAALATVPERSARIQRDRNRLTVVTTAASPNISVLRRHSHSMTPNLNPKSKVQESIELYKTKNAALEDSCTEYKRLLEEYKTNLADLKSLNSTISMELENVKRSHSYEVDDLRRKYQNDMQDSFDRHKRDLERAREENNDLAIKIERELKDEIEKLLKSHKEELETLERRLKAELEEERGKRQRERQDVQKEFDSELRNTRLEADTKERENQLLQGELTNTKSELDRERLLKNALQGQLTDATTTNLTLEASNKAMKEKIDFLESDSQAQSSAFNELHRRMQEAFAAAEAAQEKLRQEETLRRKLHNQVQELKGNIRVMCRVRPTHDSETGPAKIDFPDADTDSKEVAVQGPDKISAMGTNITQTYSYAFDRVFSPVSQNAEVFEEISQLVQSALDGYNVCVFCYGQTGSGKTFTMSSADGMIPRTVAQIYAEATRLQDKGWQYKMEGSFVEVYNETYNDLLGRPEDLDKKKIEVRHDPAKKQTTLENAVSVALDGPDRVEEILQRADKNRTVAATKANMRSSRSHSVFILKLVGENNITGERSEGTLNLVDLAGSERLDHSKAEGARLKETQNINKSLSCLGDVINALGSSKENSHIPYRNSRLTYLLQYSLGGNSKTLMFVMVSPLQAHLQETITSLKFATKVHNTHIGTAKKQTKASG